MSLYHTLTAYHPTVVPISVYSFDTIPIEEREREKRDEDKNGLLNIQDNEQY